MTDGFSLRGRIAKAIEAWHNDPDQFTYGSAADRVLEVLADAEAAAEDATWD